MLQSLLFLFYQNQKCKTFSNTLSFHSVQVRYPFIYINYTSPKLSSIMTEFKGRIKMKLYNKVFV